MNFKDLNDVNQKIVLSAYRKDLKKANSELEILTKKRNVIKEKISIMEHIMTDK